MKQPCAFVATDGWWYPGYFTGFEKVESEGIARAIIKDIGDDTQLVPFGKFIICDDIKQAEAMCKSLDEQLEGGWNV